METVSKKTVSKSEREPLLGTGETILYIPILFPAQTVVQRLRV